MPIPFFCFLSYKKSWAASRQPNPITIKTCNTIRSESVMFMCWFSDVYILLPITFLLISCGLHVRGLQSFCPLVILLRLMCTCMM